MDVPPCQLRLEEFLLRRLFGPLSLHLQEISGSPPSGDVNSYRKWHSRSEFSHDKMVILHNYVSFTKGEPILAKWNMLHPSPSTQPSQPLHQKDSQPGLLGSLPFQSQLHLQLTVGGLVGAARLAQVCHLFRLYCRWKVCGLNVFPATLVRPHSNKTSKQHDILITRGSMKTLAIRSDFDFKLS